MSYSQDMAEREGFEPSIRCRIHTFQACAFNHSATSPQAGKHTFITSRNQSSVSKYLRTTLKDYCFFLNYILEWLKFLTLS